MNELVIDQTQYEHQSALTANLCGDAVGITVMNPADARWIYLNHEEARRLSTWLLEALKQL